MIGRACDAYNLHCSNARRIWAGRRAFVLFLLSLQLQICKPVPDTDSSTMPEAKYLRTKMAAAYHVPITV